MCTYICIYRQSRKQPWTWNVFVKHIHTQYNIIYTLNGGSHRRWHVISYVTFDFLSLKVHWQAKGPRKLFFLWYFYRLNRKQSIFGLCAYQGMSLLIIKIRSSIIFMNGALKSSRRMNACVFGDFYCLRNPRKI